MKRKLLAAPRLAIGLKVALAVLTHGKPAVAATNHLLTPQTITLRNKPGKVAVERAAADLQLWANQTKTLGNKTGRMWSLVVQAASADIHSGAPLSYEEVRLWLQSYNAGPYACLKYKGNVPYKETMNYVPRVLNYFQQDLSDSPYDDVIVEKAKKYGLDPQLIRAIMKAESDFNRKTVSHAGARGLMQVMPVVWSEVRKRYKFDWNYSKDVFDPAKNIEVACAYLAWLRYDFLPSHFVEFSPNPEAPVLVKRDRKSFRPRNVSVREDVAVTQSRNKNTSAKGA